MALPAWLVQPLHLLLWAACSLSWRLDPCHNSSPSFLGTFARAVPSPWQVSLPQRSLPSSFPPLPPSLAYLLIDLPMTQKAPFHGMILHCILLLFDQLVYLLPPQLSSVCAVVLLTVAYSAWYLLGGLKTHTGGWTQCDTVWCSEVPRQCGPRLKQTPGTFSLF